jgi:hypothetical protein
MAASHACAAGTGNDPGLTSKVLASMLVTVQPLGGVVMIAFP